VLAAVRRKQIHAFDKFNNYTLQITFIVINNIYVF